MLLILAIVARLLGLIVFKVAAAFIHLLVVLAVIAIILHSLRGRRAAP